MVFDLILLPPIFSNPKKCEELIKWIGEFLPEANRDMVSSRLRALMNHDEIQETSTGHVVVSREFRAKIRSKSVPGKIVYLVEKMIDS